MRAFVAGILAAIGLAQSAEDRKAYPDYAAQFDKHGITWETAKVKTDDGYTLTMFHPTGDANGLWPKTRNSVLFMHGMGGTGLNWTMTISKTNLPVSY